MKVRVKSTGEVIEVTECFGGGYTDKKTGKFYESSEVEKIEEKTVYY